MIEAYEIGITLALDNGVTSGIAAIRQNLAALDRAVAVSSTGLINLRHLSEGLIDGGAVHPTPPLTAVAAAPPHVETMLEPNAIVVMPSNSETFSPRETFAAKPIRPAPILQPREPGTAAAPNPPSSQPSSGHNVALGLPTMAPLSVVKEVATTAPTPPFKPAAVQSPATASDVLPVAKPASTPADPPRAPSKASDAQGTSIAPAKVITADPGVLQPSRTPSSHPEPAIAPITPTPPFVQPPTETIPRSPALSPIPPQISAYAPPSPSPTTDASPAMLRPVAPIEHSLRHARKDRPEQPTPPTLAGIQSNPPQALASNGPHGEIILDGARLGRWMSDHLARAIDRPQSGTTGFDARVSPTYAGAPNGS